MSARYRYREDLTFADAAFEAQGDSAAEVFVQAADALTNLMVAEVGSVRPNTVRKVTFRSLSGPLDLEMADALREFLGKIIYWKDVDQLLLRAQDVRVREWRDEKGIEVNAVLVGEVIDPARHLLGVDVKAVTFHQLKIWREGRLWKAVVVVDT